MFDHNSSLGGHDAPVSGPDRPTFRPRRVLVVDDYLDAASSMAALIRLVGHEVRFATNGRDAVSVAETFRPDVVILDIALPIVNGREVCRWMRDQDWGARAVIVAVSGFSQDRDRQASEAAGFDLHLAKPVLGVVELVATLAALSCERERAARSNSPAA